MTFLKENKYFKSIVVMFSIVVKCLDYRGVTSHLTYHGISKRINETVTKRYHVELLELPKCLKHLLCWCYLLLTKATIKNYMKNKCYFWTISVMKCPKIFWYIDIFLSHNFRFNTTPPHFEIVFAKKKTTPGCFIIDTFSSIFL